MKKLFLMMSAVALLSGCNGDYKDWSSPMSSEAEAAKGIALAVAQAPAVDFNTLTDVPATVALFVPTVTAEEGFTVTYNATMYNADKTDAVEIPVQSVDEAGNALVNTSDLISAGQRLFGRNDESHTAPVAVVANVNVNGQVMKATGEVPFTFTLVAPEFGETFYMTGDPFGWGNFFPLQTVDLEGGKYKAYYYLEGNFKFSPVEAYDDPETGENVDWGQDPARDYGYLIQSGEENATVDEPGFYQINLDMSECKFELMKIESISIIGSVRGNWDTDIDMTYNPVTRCWSVTDDLVAGDFKMRVNHDWTYSWGGADGDPYNFDNLTEFGGKDLKIDEDGFYQIDLFLSTEGKHKVKIYKLI